MVHLTNVVPTHNRAHHIYVHLLALAAQTWKDFEVVVVADDCRDETLNAILPLIRHLPYDCRVIQTPALRRGIAGATNLGVEHALGEIVVLTDDDRIPDDAYLHTFAMLSLLPGVALSGWTEHVNHRRWREWPGSGEAKPLLFRTGSCAVWRSDWDAIGGMDENLTGWGWQDHELAYRLEQSGVRLEYCPTARSLDLWSIPGYYELGGESRDDRSLSRLRQTDYLRRVHGTWPPEAEAA